MQGAKFSSHHFQSSLQGHPLLVGLAFRRPQMLASLEALRGLMKKSGPDPRKAGTAPTGPHAQPFWGVALLRGLFLTPAYSVLLSQDKGGLVSPPSL